MDRPIFTELTPETAAAYATYLAAVFSSTVAGEGEKRIADGVEVYVFPLADGTEAWVWLEEGMVYGEA